MRLFSRPAFLGMVAGALLPTAMHGEAQSPRAAAPAPASNDAPAEVKDLTADEVDRALEAIWTRLPREEQRSAQAARRAALQAYLLPAAGTQFAAMRISAGDPAPSGARFHAEALPGRHGYLRLGTLVPACLEPLDQSLKELKETAGQGLILDLRGASGGTLPLVAELARRWVPAGTLLFHTVSSTQPEPQAVHSGSSHSTPGEPFIVLTDAATNGPAEVLAALLQRFARATVIGQPTKGSPAETAPIAISPSRFLQIPIAEALSSTSPRTPFSRVTPDVEVPPPAPGTRTAQLADASPGSVAAILAIQRPERFREASLVAGTNPETEAWIQRQLRRSADAPLSLPDTALERAQDFLTAWNLLHPEPTPNP